MAMPANLCTVPQLRRALLSAEEVAELLHVPVTWFYERTRSAAQIAFLDSVSGSTGALTKGMCAPGWRASGSAGARLLELLDFTGTLPADTGKSGHTERRSMARPRYQEGSLVVRGKAKRYVIRRTGNCSRCRHLSRWTNPSYGEVHAATECQ